MIIRTKEMISVIIPVYNGEKYLKKCVESVLNQTYTNIQIILVDDNSPDNSLEIEQEYARAYPDKIKLTALKENRGIGNAVNIGIEAADGKYLLLLGDDDWLDTDVCEKTMQEAAVHDSDLVVVPKKGWIQEKSVLYRSIPQWCFGEMNLQKKKAALVHLANDQGFVYIGIIKKSLFSEHKLKYTDILPDDIPMHPFFVAYAEHIGFIEDSCYNYRIHEASLAHQKNTLLYLTIHEAALLMRENFIKRNLYEIYKEEVDFMFVLGGYYYTIFNCLARYDERPLELMNQMKDMMQELLPEYDKNAYIPLLWEKWKLEILKANDQSPERLVECFPNCDMFLDMSHDGTLKEIFGDWSVEEKKAIEEKRQSWVSLCR